MHQDIQVRAGNAFQQTSKLLLLEIITTTVYSQPNSLKKGEADPVLLRKAK